MPELPEVEAFRWSLLPLMSKKKGLNLHLERVSDSPPRTFLSDDEIASLSDNCTVADVTRKGKLICMTLDCIKPITIEGKKQKKVYLFNHFGMTGRISTPDHVPALESLEASDEYPAPHTHLIFRLKDAKGKTIAEASYSDPRKFGSIQLAVDQTQYEEMAPDALDDLEEEEEAIISTLVEQSKPIKAILMDQKRAVAGVGNWIADEVMYQCHLHPEQKFLTTTEAKAVVKKLATILETAVDCLKRKKKFPKEWMFHYRWATKKKDAKDGKNRPITFVKSGGRTSATVASIQKLKPRQKPAAAAAKAENGDKEEKTKKKAGRPSKRKAAAAKVDEEEEEEEEEEEDKKPAAKKKAPPRRTRSNVGKADEQEEEEEAPKKRAGRPSKKKVAAKTDEEEEVEESKKQVAPKRRTRSKAVEEEETPKNGAGRASSSRGTRAAARAQEDKKPAATKKRPTRQASSSSKKDDEDGTKNNNKKAKISKSELANLRGGAKDTSDLPKRTTRSLTERGARSVRRSRSF